MALIVQDDAGTVTNANSYVTLQEFRDHCDAQYLDISGASDDAELEKAIVNATRYLDARWEFVGYRRTDDQALEWPRRHANDDRGDSLEGVPKQVKQACFGYAFRAFGLGGTLWSDPERDPTGRVVKSKDEAVGPVSEKTVYDTDAPTALPEYPEADAHIVRRGLTRQNGGGGISSVDVVRA